jgi:hypothetical protein
MMQYHLLVNLVDETFATEFAEEAGYGLAGDAGHAAEFFVGKGHGEGDRQIGVRGAIVKVVHAGPIEEGACEFAGGGVGEGKAPSAEDGGVIVAGHRRGGASTDVDEGVHEANEIGARDGFDGAGAQGDGGDSIVGVLEERGETENFTWTGDAKQEKTSLGG